MIRKLIACLYFLFVILDVDGQFNENHFEVYTVLNGLSDNNVTCIAQDEPGYIWIGTEMGLNRFDGEEFRRYQSGKEPLYIPGTYIVNIVSCSNRCLGIVTRRGFQLINPKDFTYKSYRFPDTSSFSIYANHLLDATELADKSVLLGSNTGIYTFDKPGHLNFRYDAFTSQDVGNKRISFVQRVFSFTDDDVLIYYYDKGNHLYHYGYKNKKLDYIDSTDKKWKEFYPTRWGRNCTKISQNEFILFSDYSDSLTFYNSLLNKKVVSKISCLSNQELNYESRIFKIAENTFAVTCSRSGYYLLHLDKSTGSIACDGIKYLPSYKCNYLFIDNEKRLWAGTRTGLLKQKLTSPFIQSYFLNTEMKNGLSLMLNGICRYKNKIYLGSINRFKGLLVLDTATMKIEKSLTFYGGNNGWSEVGDVQCYHKDTLWLGTTDGLLWLDVKSYHYGVVTDKNGDTVLLNANPFLYPPDKNGKAWLGDYMNGKAGYYDTLARAFTFFTVDTKPAIPFIRIKHIVYDAYGDVWIGGHGLARWNNTLKRFDTFTVEYGGPDKFSDDILAMAADSSGSLWLYNAENVLLEYNIKEKKFYVHDSREGLPEFVQAMANDVKDELWFATGNRLICYNLVSKKIFYFDQNDGLPAERASSRSIYFDKERNCFYSLHNNYLAVFPANIKEEDNNKKHLLITQIAFADTIFYNPSTDLSLSYDHTNCSVHFTVLDYDGPDAYDFFYRLDKNKTWINLEGSQVIFFNALSPGKHFIEIKATGKLGENYLTGMVISIASPFWKTWWFMVLLFLCIAAFVYLLYRNRVNQLKRLLTMRTNISQDLHDEIGSTLGSISIYSEVAKKLSFKNEKADEAISKIGTVSRELIDKMSDIVWSINPNNESFEQLQNRMRAFAAMMLTPREIEFTFHSPGNGYSPVFAMQKRRNIYLIFKEAISNIVKYANCTTVYIDLNIHENNFCMTVKDNGKGFDQNSNAVYNGNGIKNMQSRCNDMHARLNINSIINEGTIIEIILKV